MTCLHMAMTAQCIVLDAQVVQKAIEVYEGASAIESAQASVEEAGKASMQLAHLCDSLLKVCLQIHSRAPGSRCRDPIKAVLSHEINSVHTDLLMA